MYFYFKYTTETDLRRGIIDNVQAAMSHLKPLLFSSKKLRV